MNMNKREQAVEASAAITAGAMPDNGKRSVAGAAQQESVAEASCCSQREQAVCCEPAAKASCCGTAPAAPAGGCGCR